MWRDILNLNEFDMKCEIILKETCHKMGCRDYLLNMQGRCTTSYCPLKKRKEKEKNELP